MFRRAIGTKKAKDLRDVFSSLKVRNFRVYYAGQIISFSGTFMQILAQDWLVLELTNSGTMLGLVLAAQFLPMLLLTPWGGLIADRFSKLKLIYATQIISAILALALGLVVVTGAIRIWMVFAFAICLGVVNSLDNPTRNAFIFEMVGKDEVKNATSLWASLMSLARIIGPAVGGIVIATLGIGQCFIINAASYVAVIFALLLIRPEELHTVPPIPHEKAQIKKGVEYVLSSPVLLIPLVMMAIIGTITYEWSASMPLFARFVLDGGAGIYAAITVAMGVGMLIGGFANAFGGGASQKRLVYSALLLGVSILIAFVTTSLLLAIVAFVFVGIMERNFTTLTMSILQLNTDSKMRGRVMAFFSMAYLSSTAIGGPIVGWVGQQFGAPWALGIGGFAAMAAAIYGFMALRKIRKN